MHQEYHQEMPMSSVLLPEPPRKMETAVNVDEQCSVIIHSDQAAVKHLDIPSAIPNIIATIQVKVYCQKFYLDCYSLT